MNVVGNLLLRREAGILVMIVLFLVTTPTPF